MSCPPMTPVSRRDWCRFDNAEEDEAAVGDEEDDGGEEEDDGGDEEDDNDEDEDMNGEADDGDNGIGDDVAAGVPLDSLAAGPPALSV